MEDCIEGIHDHLKNLAIVCGILFIDGLARSSSTFHSLAGEFLWCFYTVSSTSSCAAVASLAENVGIAGTAMKKLSTIRDNDIGAAWNHPKPTKTRPTAPKLALACSYQDGTPTAAESTTSAKTVSAKTVKKMLAIPTTAKSCVF
jgi:hypothetical protein